MAKVDETGAQRVALGVAPSGGDVVPVSDAAPLPVAMSAASVTRVQGNVAAGAADAGDPVKIGVRFMLTPPVLTDGQRSELNTDTNGNLRVRLNGTFNTSIDTVAINQPVSMQLASEAGGGTSIRPLYVASYMFNGLTWDRQRGDTSGTFIAANVFWTESSSPLASGAALIGSLRSNGGAAGGVGSRFSFFVAEAFSDVAGGTLFIDKSVDGGTTWRQVGSQALVAGTSVSLKVPLSAVSYRVRVVNGGTAQAAALVTSSFTLN